VALGVALGLIVGKPLGITLASYLAVRSGVAQLPTGVTWPRLHGAAWLGGIGFTMSLFIAGLAFPGPAMLGAAKVGILGGSVCAGVIGYVLMRRATR
jgi:NhaA family Na+:H+ antiporter